MIELRQNEILRLLSENGYMEVTDLSEQLNVSVATIRRDLQLLEKKGKCRRKHGGGMLSNTGFMFEIPYEEKERSFIEEKMQIAEIGAEYINDGDAIILDSGSTVFQLAKKLQKKEDLTVVTNDIKTALILAANSKINLFVPGGSVLPGVYTIIGTGSVEWYEKLHVNTLFLGADAIHSDGKIMNFNDTETYAKRVMVQAADKVVVMATSDKFNRKSFMEVCDLNAVDVLITDSSARPETLKWLQQFNLEIRVTDSKSIKKNWS